MFTRRKLPVSVVFALLLALLMSVTVASAQQVTLGGSATVRDANALSDSLVIALTGVSAPAAGTTYEGWLIDASGGKVSTGALTVSGGAISQTYTSPTGANLATYATFAISSEPDPDPDPATHGTVLYSDTIVAGVASHIDHLLVSLGSNPDGEGIAVGLREQAGVAKAHAALAKNSATLADKQEHSQHVINVVEGSAGANAAAASPGDGHGVLNYAADAIAHAGFALSVAPDDAAVAELVAAANNVIADATLARDNALTVVNATTDNLLVDIALTNQVNATTRALEGSDQNADGVLSGSEGGANTVYTSAQDMGAFELKAGDVTPPVTGDALVPMMALMVLIAGLVLTSGGGLLVFRRRHAE